MEKKILALDLDGTLTNSEKKISDRTKKDLYEMMERGHIVVLASGRPMPGVIPVARELELARYGGYIVTYNGARVIRCSDDKTIHMQTVPGKLLPEIFDMADELGIGMMTYNSKGIIANEHKDEFMELEAFITHLELHHYEDPIKQIGEPVNKCLGTAPVDIAPEILKKFAERFKGRLDVGRSEPFYIELLPLGVDKATALRRLCEISAVPRENLIVCGDGYNDISMIKYAGLGVAMANAQEPVREAADYITLSNDEDGVAHVIEKYIL